MMSVLLLNAVLKYILTVNCRLSPRLSGEATPCYSFKPFGCSLCLLLALTLLEGLVLRARWRVPVAENGSGRAGIGWEFGRNRQRVRTRHKKGGGNDTLLTSGF